jgi:prepilin-type processing-associated H-X9-DG protein
MYQTMPYVEGQNVWSHRSDLVVVRDGPSVGLCPSRRPPTWHTLWYPTGELMSDYVGNGGDTDGAGNIQIGLTPIPRSEINPRGNRPIHHTGVILEHTPSLINPATSTGLILQNPLVATENIEDGTSNTVMLAEKWVASNVLQGGLWGDNFGWYQGWAWDSVRFSNKPAQQDSPLANLQDDTRGGVVCGDCDMFGSAHSGGLNAAFCDGSTRTINYDVDHVVFQMLTNRRDGMTPTEQ